MRDKEERRGMGETGVEREKETERDSRTQGEGRERTEKEERVRKNKDTYKHCTHSMGGYKPLILFQFPNFPGIISQILTLLRGAMSSVIKAPGLSKCPSCILVLFFLLHVS